MFLQVSDLAIVNIAGRIFDFNFAIGLALIPLAHYYSLIGVN